MNWAKLAIIPAVAAVVAGVLYLSRTQPTPVTSPPEYHPMPIPDFGSFKDVETRKRRFFEFMLPMVRNANASVLEERRMASTYSTRVAAGHDLSAEDSEKLSRLLGKYKVMQRGPKSDQLRRLLHKVDAVPASLILAQSATESAWGTSRFARDGNNFFGIWCYTPGCGLTPLYRDEGLTHEVTRFESVEDSVNRYLFTINTNLAYRDLRDIRARMRRRSKPADGLELAEGLKRYSEQGNTYVRQIQAMIKINKLQQYTATSVSVTHPKAG